MIIKVTPPEELKAVFMQMIALLPDKLQDDKDTQSRVLVMLKTGGLKLARQFVQIAKINLDPQYSVPQRLFPTPAERPATSDSDKTLTANSIKDGSTPDDYDSPAQEIGDEPT
jgi:hypothetical protein